MVPPLEQQQQRRRHPPESANDGPVGDGQPRRSCRFDDANLLSGDGRSKSAAGRGMGIGISDVDVDALLQVAQFLTFFQSQYVVRGDDHDDDDDDDGAGDTSDVGPPRRPPPTAAAAAAATSASASGGNGASGDGGERGKEKSSSAPPCSPSPPSTTTSPAAASPPSRGGSERRVRTFAGQLRRATDYRIGHGGHIGDGDGGSSTPPSAAAAAASQSRSRSMVASGEECDMRRGCIPCGPINPSRLARALRVRAARRRGGHFTAAYDDGDNRTGADAKAHNADNAHDDPLLHNLLDRVEVWSTKALARNVFFRYHVHGNAHHGGGGGGGGTSQTASESLLGLPDGRALGDVLPPVPAAGAPRRRAARSSPARAKAGAAVPGGGGRTDAARPPGGRINDDLPDAGVAADDGGPCLALPPTSLTWREYLRLSLVASLLQSSPRGPARTGAEAMRHVSRFSSSSASGGDVTMQEGHNASGWTPGEVVALWLRAQRNTQAFRHLVHLFVIERCRDEDEDEGDSGVGDGERASSSSPKSPAPAPAPRLKVTFRGNNKSTRSRVVLESHLLDSMAEFAVRNQVFFENRRAMGALEVADFRDEVVEVVEADAEADEVGAEVEAGAGESGGGGTGAGADAAVDATANAGTGGKSSRPPSPSTDPLPSRKRPREIGRPSEGPAPADSTVGGGNDDDEEEEDDLTTTDGPRKKRERGVVPPADAAEEAAASSVPPPPRRRRRKTAPLPARQAFVFRWFARRNRRYLSFLFSSHDDVAGAGDGGGDAHTIPAQALSVPSLSPRGRRELISRIKRHLKSEMDSSDRTFARIDRRIQIGKYDGAALLGLAAEDRARAAGSGGGDLTSSVTALIRALIRFGPWGGGDGGGGEGEGPGGGEAASSSAAAAAANECRRGLEAAVEDFRRLWTEYGDSPELHDLLTGTGAALAAAAGDADADADADAEEGGNIVGGGGALAAAEMLPKPWVDQCAVCKGNAPAALVDGDGGGGSGAGDGEGAAVQCKCCGAVVHLRCIADMRPREEGRGGGAAATDSAATAYFVPGGPLSDFEPLNRVYGAKLPRPRRRHRDHCRLQRGDDSLDDEHDVMEMEGQHPADVEVMNPRDYVDKCVTWEERNVTLSRYPAEEEEEKDANVDADADADADLNANADAPPRAARRRILPPWGIHLVHGEDCRATVDLLLSGTWNPNTAAAAAAGAGDARADLPSPVPLHIPPKLFTLGCLAVEDVEDGFPAERCGLGAGDVITHVSVRDVGGDRRLGDGDGDRDRDDDTAAPWTKYRLSSLSTEERIELFRAPHREIRLSVWRPSGDVCSHARRWLDLVYESSRAVVRCGLGLGGDGAAGLAWSSGRWYCPNCVIRVHDGGEMGAPSPKGDGDGNCKDYAAHQDGCKSSGEVGQGGVKARVEAGEIYEEARRCRAVVRRLGMEWCSLPFHDEAAADGNDNVAVAVGNRCKNGMIDRGVSITRNTNAATPHPHVSLRRLDLMMSSIMDQMLHPDVEFSPTAVPAPDVSNRNYTSSSSSSSRQLVSLLIEPFCVPSALDGSNDADAQDSSRKTMRYKRRLDWAPEGIERRPMELLCRGMELLLASPLGHDLYEAQRRELGCRFLPLFQSWCLDCSFTREVPKERQQHHLGVPPPPILALDCFSPWIGSACPICGVRAACMDRDDLRSNIDDPSVTKLHVSCGDVTCHGIAQKSLSLVAKPKNRRSNGRGQRSPRVSGAPRPSPPIPKSAQDIRNEAMDRYNFWSSFVGMTLLVLPGDELLTKICQEINMSIDHDWRCTELLVISYQLVGNKTGDGVFHAFPILFLTVVQNLMSKSDLSIADIRDLPGVVELTTEEFSRRRTESMNIRGSIDAAVCMICLRGRKALGQTSYGGGCADNMEQLRTDKVLREESNLLGASFFPALKSLSESDDDFLYGSAGVGAPCGHSNTVLDDGMNELVALIDAMMSTSVAPLHDFLSEIVRSRDSVGTPAHVDIIDHLPEAETDIGESDDDDEAVRLSRATSLKYVSREGRAGRVGKKDDSACRPEPNKVMLPEGCSCVYNDCSFDDSLSPDHLQRPPMYEPDSSACSIENKTVVLHRLKVGKACGVVQASYSDEDEWKPGDEAEAVRGPKRKKKVGRSRYSGKGWGLELVKWPEQSQIVRVGRLFPQGPGFAAQLRPHDVIVSINGLEVQDIESDLMLAKALLDGQDMVLMEEVGEAGGTVVSSKGNVGSEFPTPFSQLSRCMSVAAEGPVVLEIRRITPMAVSSNQGTSQGARTESVAPAHLEKESAAVAEGAHNCSVQGAGGKVTSYQARTQNLRDQRAKFRPHSQTAVSPQHLQPSNQPFCEQGMTGYPQSNTASHSQPNRPQNHVASPLPVQQQHQNTTPTIVQQNHSVSTSVAQHSNCPPQQNGAHFGRPQDKNHYQHGDVVNQQQKKIPNQDPQAHQSAPNPSPQIHASVMSQRPLLDARHLYSPGPKKSLLTCVETVVLVESSVRRSPALGLRLLCPRYPLDFVKKEFRDVIAPFAKKNLHLVPKLSDEYWNAILVADYKRSLNEKGPVAFVEHGFNYRFPTSVLPLDRLLESIVKRHLKVKDLAGMSSTIATVTGSAWGHGECLNAFEHGAVGVTPQPTLGPDTSPQGHASAHASGAQPHMPTKELPQARPPCQQAGQAPDQNAHLATKNDMDQDRRRDESLPVSQRNLCASAGQDNNEAPIHSATTSDRKQPGEGVIDLVSSGDEAEKLTRADRSRHEHAGEHAHSQPLPPREGDRAAPERIRGGGNDPFDGGRRPQSQSVPTGGQMDRLVLSNHAPSSWAHQYVSGKCMTTQAQADSGEAMFVGLVKPLRDQNNRTDQAEVLIFWVSNAGFLVRPVVREVPAKLLRIVSTDDEKKIVQKAKALAAARKAQYKQHVSKQPNGNSIRREQQPHRDGDRQHEHLRSTTNSAVQMPCASDGPPVQPPQRLNHVISRMYRKQQTKIPQYARRNIERGKPLSIGTASKLLVERLCLRVSPTTPLGNLPDGRSVCWLQCDPRAIYIRSFCPSGEGSEAWYYRTREYRSLVENLCRSDGDDSVRTLRIHPQNKFCCLWGCSVDVSSQQSPFSSRARCALSFSSKKSLQYHLHHCHKYPSPSGCEAKTEPEVGLNLLSSLNGHWTRVPEGNEVRRLCADLTAATCARCMDLSSVVTSVEEKDVDIESSCMEGDACAGQHGDEKNVEKRFSPSPFGSRVVFDAKRILDLTDGGKGAINFSSIAHALPRTNVRTRSILRLWSRLYRLFAVESDGKFRLSEAACSAISVSSSKEKWAYKLPGPVDSFTWTETSNKQDNEEKGSCNTPDDGDRNVNVEPQRTQRGGSKDHTRHSGLAKQLCSCIAPVSPFATEHLACPICCIGNEKILRPELELGDKILDGEPSTNRDSKPTTKDREAVEESGEFSDASRRQGVGCALLSEVCFLKHSEKPGPRLGDLYEWKLASCQSLDMLKNLLLRVASSVPRGLQKKAQSVCDWEATSGKAQTVQFSFWDQPYLKIWTDFVRHSVNGYMITQAFVLILSAIEKEKMPKWWKAPRMGWKGVYISMNVPTFSSLVTRIAVFDAAIAEFMSTHKAGGQAGKFGKRASGVDKTEKAKSSTSKPPTLRSRRTPTSNHSTPAGKSTADVLKDMVGFLGETIVNESLERLLKLSMETRMKTVLGWADRLAVKQYHYPHNDSCSVCDECGNLMCCEFCNNVQHVQCCNPPLAALPDFDWVCDECVADINVSYLYDQKTLAQHGKKKQGHSRNNVGV